MLKIIFIDTYFNDYHQLLLLNQSYIASIISLNPRLFSKDMLVFRLLSNGTWCILCLFFTKNVYFFQDAFEIPLVSYISCSVFFTTFTLFGYHYNRLLVCLDHGFTAFFLCSRIFVN